jgi:pimeloyl-ACP methyl ester carboxylesterase
MPQISVHRVNVFYRDEGTGPTVILGHSATGSSDQWRSLIGRLSNQYRLLAPDHLGYGRTGPWPGDLPLIEHEKSIIAALMGLVANPVHLVGHSFGGMIMARVAADAPERVRSLTLIEPVLFHLLAPAGKVKEHEEIRAVADRAIQFAEAGNPEEAARGFIEYWVRPGAYDAMEARIRELVTNGMAKLRVEFPTGFEERGASVQALSALSMPIQLIGGTNTTRAARAVMDVLRGIWPEAQFAEITGAGHTAPITHPQPVNEVIETFLAAQAIQ